MEETPKGGTLNQMKTISLIIALLLFTQTTKAPVSNFASTNEAAKMDMPPKLTFVEGICAGVVIGFLGGMSIYLVWKCANMIPPVQQDTNDPPVWVYPPPPPPPETNNTPTNQPAKIPVLKAEESGLQLRLGPDVTGYLTTLQGSDDLKNWRTVAHIQGYAQGTNQWFTAYDTNWQAIAAGPSLFIPTHNTFYRSVRSQ